MLKIGEFSMFSSISIYMLRNYDKIGLLVPEYTDQSTGYRYYSEEQILTANRIQALKSMGFGLKEIGQIISADIRPEQFKMFLEQKIIEKKFELEKLEAQLNQMTNSLDGISQNEEFVGSIAVKVIPKKTVASHRRDIKQYWDEGLLWATLAEECMSLSVRFSDPDWSVAIHHGKNEENNFADVEVQRAVEKAYRDTEKVRFFEVPEFKVASLGFMGGYEKIADVNFHVARWVVQNGYEINGPIFCLYHISPKHKQKEEEFITEVCFPIINPK
jgi:DNA-binding transcriptional MerR regulator